FTIDSKDPEITLERPTGGELWLSGTTEKLKWDDGDPGPSGYASGGCELYFSDDGGASWSSIDTYEDCKTGSPYEWTVDNVSTNQARIRIVAHDNVGQTSADTSGDFTIETDWDVKTTLPSGGDEVRGDNPLYIDWSVSSDNMQDTAGSGEITRISFQESFLDSPVVVVQIQDANNEPVNAEVRTVTTDYMDLNVCGSGGGDDNCPDNLDPPFEVSYVAIEQDDANHSFDASNLTSGREVTGGGGSWLQVSHPLNTSNEAFVTSVNTHNGSEDNKPTEVRERTSSTFEMRYCEHDDGNGCDSHSDEEVAYIGADRETLNADGGAADGEANVTSANLTDSSWITVTFNNSYDSPVALATVNTDNSGEEPMVAETRNVSSDSMEV
ncbi:MAG: hypothetical protein ABEK50_00245, partial [bacterium]